MRKWMLSLLFLALPAGGCSRHDEVKPTPGGSAPANQIGSPSPTPSVAASYFPTTSPKASAEGPSPKGNTPIPIASVQPSVWSPSQAKLEVEARAREVIGAIRDLDLVRLDKLAHPDKGIRFSPSCYVDIKKDLVFHSGEIRKLQEEPMIRTWGTYDGSGEPIRLTFEQYYKKFLYDHDYAKAEKIGYNETWGKGNTTNNIKQVYPEAVAVEYYFSGFDPKLEGHDWASLSLIMERKDGEWYLTGIVCNRWTI